MPDHGKTIQFFWSVSHLGSGNFGIGTLSHGDHVVGKIIGKLLQDLIRYRAQHTPTETRHFTIYGDFRVAN